MFLRQSKLLMNNNIQNSEDRISAIISPATTETVRTTIKDADEHTLVIWDIDGVILIGQDRIFHSDNIYSGLNQKYVEYICAKYKLTKLQSDRFLSQLLLLRTIKLVDDQLLNIIHDLKNRRIKAIALTQFATGPLGDIPSIADWRINELKKLGIIFDFAFDDLIQLELNKLNKIKGYHPLYKSGILFCERHPKGDVLGEFLDMIKWRPNKVIFIEDKLENLKVVQAELRSRNISYVGLHYTESAKHPTAINDKVVKLQYEQVLANGIWLDDQAALEKL
jgi:hypothetical protein